MFSRRLAVTPGHLGWVFVAWVALVLLGGCATGSALGSLTSGFGLHAVAGSGGGFPVHACGGQPLPPGWPELPSGDAEALLAPFLACTPAEFVELQDGVDMPRLVEALDDWRAVRLGALGPVREAGAWRCCSNEAADADVSRLERGGQPESRP